MEKLIPQLYYFGDGSAFNIKRGNSSAFTYLGRSDMCAGILVLFDVNQETYRTLFYNKALLENVHQIIICITHTHPDHINGLADLLYYLRFVKKGKPQVDIITPSELMTRRIFNLLKVFEIDVTPRKHKSHYTGKPWDDMIFIKEVKKTEENTILNVECENDSSSTTHTYKIQFKRNLTHGDTLSYYVYLSCDDHYIIYTGDTGAFPPALNDYDFINCEQIYIDCTTIHKEWSGHYSVDQIMAVLRSFNTYDNSVKKITPMHFQNLDVVVEADKYGMNMPQIVTSETFIEDLDFSTSLTPVETEVARDKK